MKKKIRALGAWAKLCLPATATFAALALPLAAHAANAGLVAQNISSQFTSIADLIVGSAYLMGAGCVIQSIMQFKKHNDNPQQVPLSRPITYAVVAACLLSLPSFVNTAVTTPFGDEAQPTQINNGGSHLIH